MRSIGSYLVVTPFFPSRNNWRGAYCFDFVKALSRATSYDVKVFVPGVGSDYEFNGIMVYRFPTRQLPSNVLPFLFRHYNERSFLKALCRAGIKVGEVKVCHAHTSNLSIYPLAIKRFNSTVAAILQHHDLQSYGLNLGVLKHSFLHNAWLFCRLRTIFERLDCHVFISEKSRESFLKAPDTRWTNYELYSRQMSGPRFFHCRHVRIKHSIILHNGVDTSIFHLANTPRPRLLTSTFIIGCIGNFEELKDQVTLIRACASVEVKGYNVKVVFIGSGPTFKYCRDMARKLGVDAEFRTEMAHEKLADFYRSLDLFVLPSCFEGYGCVYTEAWACGVPFIACEGQGIDDVIRFEDRHLWLAKPHDANDLAQKIEYYMRCRPNQNLTGRVTMDDVITGFLEDLKKCAW